MHADTYEQFYYNKRVRNSRAQRLVFSFQVVLSCAMRDLVQLPKFTKKHTANMHEDDCPHLPPHVHSCLESDDVHELHAVTL